MEQLSEHRGQFDRHKNIGKFHAELGNRTGGRIGREELGVFFIQAREISGARQEHQDLDNILKCCTGRTQNTPAVNKRLARLLLNSRPSGN
jgi:hypothetical protein